MELPNPYTQRELATARDLPPHSGPLAAANVSFHEAYTRLVEQVLLELGESVAVIVLIGDDATLFCDGSEQRGQVIPAAYHELKALAHLGFGVQLSYCAEREDRLVYGEDLADVDAALGLLARHMVDQRASNLLFGDRRRLQEDLLADAASTEVRKLLPKVRGCPSGAHRRRR
jgi:hypothetical protein